MLTIKTLSVLTVILMANVSTAIANQDNKDDNTNTSDTLNLSGPLSLSTSSASDANYSSDAYAEGKPYCNIITSAVQQEHFVCDESVIEKKDEEELSTSFEYEVTALIGELTSNATNVGG